MYQNMTIDFVSGIFFLLFGFLFQAHVAKIIKCFVQTINVLQVLEPLLLNSPQETSLIDDYREYHTDTVVRFQIKFKNGKLPVARQRGLHQVKISTHAKLAFKFFLHRK
jgi:hypothetical protein